MLVRAFDQSQKKYLDKHTNVWRLGVAAFVLAMFVAVPMRDAAAQGAPQISGSTQSPQTTQTLAATLPRPLPGDQLVRMQPMSQEEALAKMNSIPPDPYLIDPPKITPSASRAGIKATAALTSQAPVEGPGSVAELGRALKNDPDLIYEYVYNNIDYEPMWGELKGSVGTILDGRGDDFDQAILMVTLLRQAGFTTSYMLGKIRLGPTDLANWLGVSASSPCAAFHLLGNDGIPVTKTPTDTTCTQPLQYLDISHVWVKVTINGTAYFFDPSFKQYDRSATGINLASAMGYNQSALITGAEQNATIDTNTPPNFIQNINRTNLRNTLTGYANTLVSYLRQNNPTSTMTDIIGGKKIIPVSASQPLRQTTLPNETPGDVPTEWTGAVPNSFRTILQLNLTDVTPGGTNQLFSSFFSDAIYGHRLALIYNSSLQPTIWFDGNLQGTGAASVSPSDTLTLTATHPYGAFSAVRNLAVGANNTFFIINAWGAAGRGMIEKHRKALATNRLQAGPGSESTEPVLGETLAVMGYSWVAQFQRSTDILDRLNGTTTIRHNILGVAGQTTSPYIDAQSNTSISGNTDSSSATINQLLGAAGHASALESGTVEQTLTTAGAVSTVKLLDLASQTSDRLFDATAANYNSVIRPIIQPNYSTADLTAIDTQIAANWRVILPEHGRITEGTWTGVGFLQIASNQLGVGYYISGGLKGGFSDNPVAPSQSFADTNRESVTDPLGIGGLDLLSPFSLEPINLFNGDYLYDHEDISVGAKNFPYGLSLQRKYNSGTALQDGPMGLGWSHNLNITAQIGSDGFKGMGSESPIDAASAIVGAFVTSDLMSDTTKPLAKMLIGTLAQRWWVDQLIDNTVDVAQPNSTQRFTKLADGSYNPPLGSADNLTLASGAYKLQAKDGTTLNFNTAGNLATWAKPSGMTVTFNYDGSNNLTSVTNGLNRTLTFTYTGNHITQVSDGNGRSISYSYDSTGNLTAFQDATGNPANKTTFAYGQPGKLTQIFYPSFPTTPFVTNTYDSNEYLRFARPGDDSGEC